MTKQPDLMGMAGPAGLPRGEQGVKGSSGNEAKASGSALPREGQRPFPFQRLGVLVATIVAALTVTGCETTISAPLEPRALTKGNYQPLCVIWCSITTSLTNHEPISSLGGGSVTNTQQGGTATSSQNRSAN